MGDTSYYEESRHFRWPRTWQNSFNEHCPFDRRGYSIAKLECKCGSLTFHVRMDDHSVLLTCSKCKKSEPYDHG